MNRAAITVAVAAALVLVTLFAVSTERSDADTGLDLDGCCNGDTLTYGGVTYVVYNEPGHYSGAIGCDSIIVDMETVDEDTFDPSLEVRTVVFTSKVKQVRSGAFQDNSCLESIETLGKRHITFRGESFSGCSNLKFIDFRTGVNFEIDAFPPDCDAILLLDFEPRISFSSNPKVVIPSNVEGVQMVRYVDSSIQVLYTGNGLLECSYGDGSRSFGTASDCPGFPGRIIAFKCNEFDSIIDYKSVSLSYEDVYGIDDETAVFSDSVFELASIPAEYDVDFRGWTSASGEFIGSALTSDYVRENDVCELTLVPSVSFTITFGAGDLPAIEPSEIPESTECGYGGFYPGCGDTEHYTFEGWLVDGSVVPAEAEVTAIWSHAAEAVWTPKPECVYSVTYANCDGSPVKVSEGYGYGKMHTVDGTVPSDVGVEKTFVGWSVPGGVTATKGTKVLVTGDVVLSPVLADREVYTATFVSLGSVVHVQTAYDGVSMTIRAKDPSLDGYRFLGWSAEGTRGLLHRGDTILLTRDTVLEAVWEKVEVFTVTLHCGGSTVATLSGHEGERVALPGCPDGGHASEGWALSEDGPVAYVAGDSVKLTKNLDLHCVHEAASDDPQEPAAPGEETEEETPGGGADAPPEGPSADPGRKSMRAEATVIAVGTAAALVALMALLVLRRS